MSKGLFKAGLFKPALYRPGNLRGAVSGAPVAGALPPFLVYTPAPAEPERRQRHARATAEPLTWTVRPAPVPQRPPPRIVNARAVAEPLVLRHADARAFAEPVLVTRYYPVSVRAAAEPAIVGWWTAWHRELAVRIQVEDELLLLGAFDV